MAKRKKNKLPAMTNDVVIENGFSEAIGYNQNGFFGGGPGIGGGFAGGSTFPGGPTYQQLSSSTTLFENLRWYLVSNFRQLLNQLFAEIGLVKTIVCVPVDDGLRGGVLFKSKQLNEEQIIFTHLENINKIKSEIPKPINKNSARPSQVALIE
jgi:hypothetical protein